MMKAQDQILIGTVQAKMQLFLYDLQDSYNLTFQEVMLVLAELQRSIIFAELKAESEAKREQRESESRGQEDDRGGSPS